MTDFLSELLDIEWFRVTLLAVVAVSVLVLVSMIPMYFVVWPVLRKLRTELAAFVILLARGFADRAAERGRRLDERAAEFLKDGGLQRFVEVGGGPLGGLGSAARALRRLRRPVAKAANAMAGSGRSVEAVRDQLRKANLAEPSKFPEVLSADVLTASQADYRRAWLRLAVSLVLLIALMIVNTALASTILPAIGVISPSFIVAGIPLATIVAFLLAATETGIGVCHSGTRHPDKLPVWPAFFFLLALPISFFDGWAFSQIADATATFRLPVVAYVMPQADLFFMFGFVITWTLFGLGALAYESGAEVLGGRGDDLLGGALRRLTKLHDRYADAVGRSKAALAAAADVSAEGMKTLQGENPETLSKTLEALKTAIDAMKVKAPFPGILQEKPLTRVEVWQLANHAGFWLMGAIVGTTVMAVIGWNTLAASLQPAFKAGLAIGQALVCLGVGSLLSAGESIVVRGGSPEERHLVVGGPRFSRIAAYVIGAGLMSTYLVLAWVAGMTWIVTALVGLFLMAAGHQLTPLLGVVSLWLAMCWGVIVAIGSEVVLLLIRIVKVIVIVLEFIAGFFAEPLRRLFSGHGGSGSSHPPSMVGV